MLIPTIEFDLRSPITGEDTHSVVEWSPDNEMLVLHDKRTHNIHYTQTFDFQLNRFKLPKFIRFGDAVLEALDECLSKDSDGVDYGDRMA